MTAPEASNTPRHAGWTGEPSPWLLPHLDSPVRWRPWQPERLVEARAADAPVLLVMASADCLPFEQMARESFADPLTATVMNEDHVCVLADARWHPELDRQLQWAHQLLTGRAGGWPLVALVDPLDARPYFVGTYLPAQSTGSLPGFRKFLQQARQHHRRTRAALLAQGERLAAAMLKLHPARSTADAAPDRALLDRAREQLAAGFDAATGLFRVGDAEIPMALACRRLLRHWWTSADSAEPDLHALYLATRALSVANTRPAAPPEQQADWLILNAVTAHLTGDRVFAEAADRRAERLSGAAGDSGKPLPDDLRLQAWQALVVAGRWLGRDDWLQASGRQFGDWRHGRDPTALPPATLSAALATATALLPVRRHESECRWTAALAAALAARLAHPGATALPGLPMVSLAADEGRPSPLGLAIRSLRRHASQTQDAPWTDSAQRALSAHWAALRDAPLRHLTLLEAWADGAGDPDIDLGPSPT